MKIIPISTLHRLEKLLEMTASTNDPEALNAIRLTNKVLKDNKITWSELFRKMVSTSSAPLPYSGSDAMDAYDGDMHTTLKPDAMTVEEALAFMRARKPSNFIESLANFYAERGYLTRPQKERLFEGVREQRGR